MVPCCSCWRQIISVLKCLLYFMFLKVTIYQFPFFLPLCLITKELQKAIDNRKAIILSINLCSSEFTQSDSEESKKLQERLSQMNVRWEHVCSMIEDWRSSLQDALIQCQVCTVPISNCQQPTYWKYKLFSHVVCSKSVWNLPMKAKMHLWHVFLKGTPAQPKTNIYSPKSTKFVISGIVF